MRAAVQQAIDDLGDWLSDNTVEVFEEQPEIDTIRGQLMDALDKVQDDHVQTSMCIWECLTAYPKLRQIFEDQGVCEMRDRAVELTPWVEQVYALMDPEAKDMEAFDLGIVPMILDWVSWRDNGQPDTPPAAAVASKVSKQILNQPQLKTYEVTASRRFVSRHVSAPHTVQAYSHEAALALARQSLELGSWDPTDNYVEQASGYDDADNFEVDVTLQVGR